MDNYLIIQILFVSGVMSAAYHSVKYGQALHDLSAPEDIDLDSELYSVDELNDEKDKIHTYFFKENTGHGKLQNLYEKPVMTQKTIHQPWTTKLYQFRKYTRKPTTKPIFEQTAMTESYDSEMKTYDPLHRYKEAINKLINKYKQTHTTIENSYELEEPDDMEKQNNENTNNYLSKNHSKEEKDSKITTKKYKYYYKYATPTPQKNLQNKNLSDHYYTKRYSIGIKKPPITTTAKYKHVYNNHNYHITFKNETTTDPEIKLTTQIYQNSKFTREQISKNSNKNNSYIYCDWLQSFSNKLKMNEEKKTNDKDTINQQNRESVLQNNEPEINNKYTTTVSKKLYDSYTQEKKNQNDKEYYSDDYQESEYKS